MGDHAGRRVPFSLGDLGVAAADFDRHIAWDIGVAGLGERLAAALDAPFIRQTYSRLVIDCNRAPGEPEAIPEVSDGTVVPGNLNLSAADRAARVEEIHAPYQAAIAGILDACPPVLLVSLHSFTPVFQGFVRPWRYGVLHRDDSEASRRLLAGLRARLGDEAGDNQPYAMDGVDHTVPLHADPRALDYLELEVRQDLIADPAGQDAAAALLAELLVQL